MSRRVCVVTGTRAEYGLLRSLIREIADDQSCELLLIVTGTHLAPEFGMTAAEIEADGMPIAERVEILLSSDTAVGTSKAMGLAMIGFGEAFARHRPHIVVLLGDRFEVLAAAAAATVAAIPLAHIHGGEVTEGAFDDAIRHAVTKMSHLHFVAAEPYRDRILQMGEDPERVYVAGALGVDAMTRLQLMTKADVEASLGIELGPRNLLITYHPVTLDADGPEAAVGPLLGALSKLNPDTCLIFTLPNADPGGRGMADEIRRFAAQRRNAHVFASLGQIRYYSLMQYVDGVVGNSSSGLIEAPSMKVGTVDIGDRQKGRLRASSVIHCSADESAITHALAQLYAPQYRAGLAQTVNPYAGEGGSCLIGQVLRSVPLQGLTRKAFRDLSFTAGPV